MASQRQIEACRRNWKQWRGVTPEGRQRLRDAARRNRPWLHSTGPTSDAGKARTRANAVRWGMSCATLEPYATQTRLAKAILAYAHAYADFIRQSDTDDDESISIPPEVTDGIAWAYCDFCDQHGITFTESEVEETGVVWLIQILLDKVEADTGRQLGVIHLLIKAEGIRQRAEHARAWRLLRR